MAIDLSSNNPVGFRFHPTDAELVTSYLKPKILGRPFSDVIAEIDLCQSEPWDLPEKSKIKSKDKVWWFLCRRDYKSPSSKRTKRTTNTGFWKITGQERMIKDEDTKQCLGRKKTLTFYSGTSPGKRTNWVMQEITLDPSTFTSPHHQMDAYVICKLKRKTDESAETPEGEIHQMVLQANSSRELSASEENVVIGEPNWGVITREDGLQLLDEADSFEESPEEEFANSLLCDPDEWFFSDAPFIAQAQGPSKRPCCIGKAQGPSPAGSDTYTDAEVTNGWSLRGTAQMDSSSFDSSAVTGSKKVRNSMMKKTPRQPTYILQCSGGIPIYGNDNSSSAAVALEKVGPTNVTVTGGGSRQKRVQFQNIANSDKAKEATKHGAGKEVCEGEPGGDKKAVAKSAKSRELCTNASESQSLYEYCLYMLVGVLFGVFVLELVVGW